MRNDVCSGRLQMCDDVCSGRLQMCDDVCVVGGYKWAVI